MQKGMKASQDLMKTKQVGTEYPVSIICSFVWIGFVCAISFMEAWLKFEAPGITIPLGLGIGRLVFGLLNYIEWILALVILAEHLFLKRYTFKRNQWLYILPLLILLIQSLYLLPKLDVRAQLIIDGLNESPSNLHFVYIALEFIKVSCLTLFGISLFKKRIHDR